MNGNDCNEPLVRASLERRWSVVGASFAVRFINALVIMRGVRGRCWTHALLGAGTDLGIRYNMRPATCPDHRHTRGSEGDRESRTLHLYGTRASCIPYDCPLPRLTLVDLKLTCTWLLRCVFLVPCGSKWKSVKI